MSVEISTVCQRCGGLGYLLSGRYPPNPCSPCDGSGRTTLRLRTALDTLDDHYSLRAMGAPPDANETSRATDPNAVGSADTDTPVCLYCHPDSDAPHSAVCDTHNPPSCCDDPGNGGGIHRWSAVLDRASMGHDDGHVLDGGSVQSVNSGLHRSVRRASGAGGPGGATDCNGTKLEMTP